MAWTFVDSRCRRCLRKTQRAADSDSSLGGGYRRNDAVTRGRCAWHRRGSRRALWTAAGNVGRAVRVDLAHTLRPTMYINVTAASQTRHRRTL
eukprot:scaffold4147_cov412-Prasinococcus_capsulatus_cf.AAC.5